MFVPPRVAFFWDTKGSRLHRLNHCCWGVLTTGRGFFHLQFWLFSFHRCWNQVKWNFLFIRNRRLENTGPLYQMVLVPSQQSSIFQLNYKRSWTSRLFQNSSDLRFMRPLLGIRCKGASGNDLLFSWQGLYRRTFYSKSSRPGV